VRIGEGVGSCGTAAYRRERFIVEDTSAHPFWAPYRELAERAGCAACWSEPIFSSTGGLLGTFAVYYAAPTSPDDCDFAALKNAVHLASIAIEWNHSQQARFESEALLRGFADATSVGIGIAGTDGMLRFTNPALRWLVGEESSVARTETTFYSYYAEEDRERFDQEILPSVMARGSWQGEIDLSTAERGRVATEQNVVLVRDAGGDPWRLAFVVTDIRARKKAQRELRESREQLARVADSAPVGVFELYQSAEGERQFGFVSKKLGELLVVTPDAALADSDALFQRIEREDRSVVVGEFASSASSLRPCRVEFRVHAGHRGVRWMYSEAIPRRAPGDSTVWVGYLQDITERRAVQDELARARDKAEAAAEAKNKFLYTISHEVRTPLNAILGFGELLEQSVSEDWQREAVQNIRNSGQELLSVVHEVLDFSRLEAGQMQLQIVPVDLRQMLQSLYTTFRQKALARGLSLAFEVAPAVPESLRLDQVRLRQVLWNLIGNALKFTDVGRVRVFADGTWTDSAPPRFRLELLVEDTGLGIPQEDRNRLFGAFVQGKGHSEVKYGGVGLGLPITKRLLDLMGGTIKISDTPGGGATFTVVFDVEEDLEACWQGSEGESGRPPSSRFRLHEERPDSGPSRSLMEGLAEAACRSPGLLEKVRAEVEPLWESICGDYFSVTDIEELGTSIAQLGREFDCTFLNCWGGRLSSQARNFDIEAMNATLRELPVLLSTMALDPEGGRDC